MGVPLDVSEERGESLMNRRVEFRFEPTVNLKIATRVGWGFGWGFGRSCRRQLKARMESLQGDSTSVVNFETGGKPRWDELMG